MSLRFTIRSFEQSHESFSLLTRKIEYLNEQLNSMFQNDVKALRECQRLLGSMKRIVQETEEKSVSIIHRAVLDLNQIIN